MAEVSVLVPELPIQVPDEMIDLFNTLAHVLHPDTPMHKTSKYFSRDIDSIPRENTFNGPGPISIPALSRQVIPYSEAEPYNDEEIKVSPIVDVGVAMTGVREPNSTALAFAERHVQGEKTRSLFGPNKDIWLLALEVTTFAENIGRSAIFAANSNQEFTGYVRTWELGIKGSGIRQAIEMDSDRLNEYAKASARILVPIIE